MLQLTGQNLTSTHGRAEGYLSATEEAERYVNKKDGNMADIRRGRSAHGFAGSRTQREEAAPSVCAECAASEPGVLTMQPQNQGCHVGSSRHRFWALVASSTSMCAPRCTDDRAPVSPAASAGGAT